MNGDAKISCTERVNDLVPRHLRNFPEGNKQRDNRNAHSNYIQIPPLVNQLVALCIRLGNIPTRVKRKDLVHSRNDCEKGKGKDAQGDGGIHAHELLKAVGGSVVRCRAVGDDTEGDEGNVNLLGNVKVGAKVGDSVRGVGDGTHLGDEDAVDVDVAACRTLAGIVEGGLGGCTNEQGGGKEAQCLGTGVDGKIGDWHDDGDGKCRCLGR